MRNDKVYNFLIKMYMNRDTVKKILIKKKKDTLCSLMERLDITQMSISPQISIEFKFNSNYNITGFSP